VPDRVDEPVRQLRYSCRTTLSLETEPPHWRDMFHSPKGLPLFAIHLSTLSLYARLFIFFF
jgi:hypothetical protein